MRKVLLLNPPGKQLYIRCYYCSKTSKANYIPPPIDLVFLSGILSENYDVQLLDALIEGLNNKRCIQKIVSLNPDIIISLTGAVSWDEDIKFFKELKESKKCDLILNGDILLSGGDKKLAKYPFIDAIMLDFTTNDVLYYLSKDYKKVRNMIYRKNGRIINAPLTHENGEFSIPIPKHELFMKYKYRYPFMKDYPMASVLTDYGCPYKCEFCIMATLGFKYRKLDNVINELRYLKSLGIKDVYFSDQTFGAIKKRNLRLCNEMIKEKMNLRWCCFSRVDVVDYEILNLMKQAGCHTIMFGVESASENILKIYKKQYSIEQIRKAFRLAKEAGIKTMGTFLMGLPEDDMESCLKTIDLAKQLDCDYASFNFAVPRANTKLREKAFKQSLISKDFETADQAGTKISMPTHSLSKEDIKKLRRKALISFYFRPSYVIKRFLSLTSYSEFKIQVQELRSIIKSLI